MQDLRHALRLLARSPSFTLVSVLLLALGISGVCAVFSAIDAVLLAPLPYRFVDRLVVVWEKQEKMGIERNLTTPADYFDWQQQSESFEELAAYTEAFFSVTAQERSQRLAGAITTVNLLETLGVEPVRGRFFLPEEARPRSEGAAMPPVVVVSHAFWQRRLGSTPDLDTTTLRVDGQRVDVVGVLPADFLVLGKGYEVLRPFAPDERRKANRSAHYLTVLGRLRPNVGLGAAQVGMDVLARRLEQAHAATNTGHGVRLVPIAEEIVGGVRPALLLLFGAVGCVLLITCVNVANLQLARTVGRAREIAVRAALGAGRTQILRQLSVEGLLLAGLGGIGGIVLTPLMSGLILGLSPGGLPRLETLNLSWRVLGCALVAAGASSLLIGLLPAFKMSRPDLVEALKAQGRSAGGRTTSMGLRRSLLIAELALSSVLLVGAGLMLKSFARLLHVDPGFTSERRIALDVSAPWWRLDDDEDPAIFLHRLLERLRERPELEGAGITSHLPLSGEDGARSFTVEGRPAGFDGETFAAEYRRASVGYFETLSIPLVRGRRFAAGDDRDAPRVAVVNQALVRRFFPDEDPLGQKLVIRDGIADPRVIIGVVGDVRHFRLDAAPEPEMYVPMLQRPWSTMALVLAVRSGVTLDQVRGAVMATDPLLALADVRPLERDLARSRGPHRFVMSLLLGFASLAFVLALLGVYSVQSYLTRQLEGEIGIRLALGAQRRDLLRWVLAQGMGAVAAGTAAGLLLAWAMAGLLEGFLYEVDALDAGVFVLVPLVLAAMALLACFVPPMRSTRVDPTRLFSQ